MQQSLDQLLTEIRACRICDAELPEGPRPVVRASKSAKILVVGQAPGRRVHETGIPFNDPSGDRLRDWMGIDREVFYDENRVNILPMGFCYPGTGKSGDLPPRPECADHWREKLMAELGEIEFTLIIGQYAMDWHLRDKKKKTVTETVKSYEEFWPVHAVLPHPSPRNNIWLRRNPWFEEEIIPKIQERIRTLL